ncbi:MAG: PTS sugar transporter subunit IIA [Pseudomonadota bacterium]
MADLSNVLDNESIIELYGAKHQTDVLVALAERLSPRSGLRPDIIADAMQRRAVQDPVGVGDGVAIPHARLAGVKKPIGAFARLQTPVDFAAHDERPCDLVFALLAPKDEDAAHLKALAQISRAFRDSGLRAALRRQQTNVRKLLLGRPRGAAA